MAPGQGQGSDAAHGAPAPEGPLRTLCDERKLPPPSLNVEVLGRKVDAFWPAKQLIVELDCFAYHHHRAAFERDRAWDAALQTAGYRAVRLTHRRLDREANAVEAELRRLLAQASFRMSQAQSETGSQKLSLNPARAGDYETAS